MNCWPNYWNLFFFLMMNAVHASLLSPERDVRFLSVEWYCVTSQSLCKVRTCVQRHYWSFSLCFLFSLLVFLQPGIIAINVRTEMREGPEFSYRMWAWRPTCVYCCLAAPLQPPNLILFSLPCFLFLRSRAPWLKGTVNLWSSGAAWHGSV